LPCYSCDINRRGSVYRKSLDYYRARQGRAGVPGKEKAMARPRNKEDLLRAAQENYEKLTDMVDSMTEKELTTPFDFAQDEKKKEAHWRRDKNVRDVLIHLYEWHQLMIHFTDENMAGRETAFLPKPYTWKTYGAMNQFFYEKHQNTPMEDAKAMLAESHQEVMKRIEGFTNEELFLEKVFPAVGGTVLGSFFVSTTSSHYEWAMKKLKAHKKNCK
jgi:hypothetical protein